MRRYARNSSDFAICMLGTGESRLQLSHSLAVSSLALRARVLNNSSLSRATRKRGETLRDVRFNKSVHYVLLASAYLLATLAAQYR